MAQAEYAALVRLPFEAPDKDWEILDDGESVPQSEGHGDAVLILLDVLRHWAKTAGTRVLYDCATRWVESNPRIGVDPDVSILHLSPVIDHFDSIRTWLPGHVPPRVAIEVVSKTNRLKDYSLAPAKYAASGIEELWIFDPQLVGPRTVGKRFRLQVYRRAADGGFDRVYKGSGPAYSTAVGAWLVVVNQPPGRRPKLRIANDEAGAQLWLTEVEAANARAEAANAELAAANAENAALRAQLAAKSEK